LFVLAVLFAYLTTVQPSFNLLASRRRRCFPWAVRSSPGTWLGCACFTRWLGVMIAFRLTDAALRESCEDSEFEALRTKPRADADGITTALEEARSKPSFSRFNDEVDVSIAEELDCIQQRIVAMCRDSLSSHARVLSALVPELEPLARETVHSLLGPASATPGPTSGLGLERLARAEAGPHGRLQHLRDTRVTSPSAWTECCRSRRSSSNLKEVVASLKALAAKLGRLS
jgi:hypothetical protein